jgi:hypothetical protein
MAKRSPAADAANAGSRRRAIMIKVDDEVRNELDVLSRLRGEPVQALGLEAICDLLRKHGRPVSMRDAFRRSAGDETGSVKKSRTTSKRTS